MTECAVKCGYNKSLTCCKPDKTGHEVTGLFRLLIKMH